MLLWTLSIYKQTIYLVHGLFDYFLSKTLIDHTDSIRKISS